MSTEQDMAAEHDRPVPGPKETQGAIEAILFAAGDPVELSRIAKAVGHDRDTTRKMIRHMMTEYEADDRGIQIIELEGSYQLCTKQKYFDSLVGIVQQPPKAVLTDVMLETLSIIAYRQPVTRQEIEKIRGVSCSHAISKLTEYHLIQEVGRLDAPGRPILFGTTEEFLRCFGVESKDELPAIDPVKTEDFRSEAEKEIQLELKLQGG